MAHRAQGKWYNHAWAQSPEDNRDQERSGGKRGEREKAKGERNWGKEKWAPNQKDEVRKERVGASALLEIYIRVSEFSITTRFGGLEKRLEELETATSSRDSFDLESNQRKNDEMESTGDDEMDSTGDDEGSTGSEQSN